MLRRSIDFRNSRCRVGRGGSRPCPRAARWRGTIGCWMSRMHIRPPWGNGPCAWGGSLPTGVSTCHESRSGRSRRLCCWPRLPQPAALHCLPKAVRWPAWCCPGRGRPRRQRALPAARRRRWFPALLPAAARPRPAMGRILWSSASRRWAPTAAKSAGWPNPGACRARAARRGSTGAAWKPAATWATCATARRGSSGRSPPASAARWRSKRACSTRSTASSPN